MESFSFGFIDKKQKKIWVLPDIDLADAYAAAISGQSLWVDPSQTVVVDEERGSKKAGKQANKRKHNLLKLTRVNFFISLSVSLSKIPNFL